MVKRISSLFAALLFVIIAVSIWNICIGSVHIPLSDIFTILSGKSESITNHRIIWNIRLSRIIAALLLGGALSVSGFLLQTFFCNPIAGPHVLGISSGAKLAVTLAMIFF